MENFNNYINKFLTEIDVQEAVDNNELIKPYVAYVEQGSFIDWNTKVKEGDYSRHHLTLKITSAGNINVPSGTTYSINGGEWENTGTTLTVNGGEIIKFKGNNGKYENNNFSNSSAGFIAEGNIMSLLYGDDFINQSSLSDSRTFYFLFSGCTGLTTAENLILPATSLTDYCYYGMFEGCRSLTTAPSKLPAGIVGISSYRRMFKNCSSLTTAPEILSRSINTDSCREMFNGCSSLTTAPELPATTLGSFCYLGMFSGCTSLTNVPSVLPSINLIQGCYAEMFHGCTSLTTAPELPATVVISKCYRNMFSDCTSLTTAPELPATSLQEDCYSGMFNNCSSLNYIKCMATANIGVGYTSGWVYGVTTSTGTFVKATGVEWPTSTSGIPSGWTVQEV